MKGTRSAIVLGFFILAAGCGAPATSAPSASAVPTKTSVLDAFASARPSVTPSPAPTPRPTPVAPPGYLTLSGAITQTGAPLGNFGMRVFRVITAGVCPDLTRGEGDTIVDRDGRFWSFVKPGTFIIFLEKAGGGYWDGSSLGSSCSSARPVTVTADMTLDIELK